MPRIPLELVKELRRRTGASVVECRRALEATDGDVRRAARLLRLQALTVAARRATIGGPNGVVAAHVLDDGSAGALVEVSFETRRSARADRFRQFVSTLARQVAREPVHSLESLLDQPFADKPTRVVEELGDMILRTGETFGVRRFVRFAARRPGVVAGYAHGTGPMGRLGVLLEVTGAESEGARRLARELTFQVVFHRPPYLRRQDVPPARLVFEREAIRRRLEQEGGRAQAPDALADEILRNSFFRSMVLMDQPWVKDVGKTVGELVEECSEQAGVALQVRRYVLLEVGGPVEEASLPEGAEDQAPPGMV